MKSSATWDQGRLGVCKGLGSPERETEEDLFWAHVLQGATYSRVPLFKENHQKYLCMKETVR